MKQLEDLLENGKVEEVTGLLDFMIKNIGTTDPILRDHKIYRAFYKLISEQLLTIEQQNQLLSTMADGQFYLYKIGEQQNDSVFQRSFSALVVALLLEFDHEHLKLQKNLVEDAFDQAIYYMEHEEDRRGHVDGKGWAHGIAHGADVLDAVAKHPYFSDIPRLLHAIEVPLLSGHPFTDDEEERLAIPVLSLLSYKDAEDEVLTWLQELISNTNQVQVKHQLSIHPYRVQHTVKNFLKSLYFFLQFKDESIAVREQINENLMKWSYI